MAEEPRKVPKVCQRCGGETFAFVVLLRDAKTGKFSERELGGELCETCSDVAEAAGQLQEWNEKHARNLEGSFLPDALRNLDFDGFTQPEAVDLAKRWGAGNIAGLCLTGAVGVGKTRLAAAAAWQMLYRRRVRWVDTAQLVAALRASFDDEDRARSLRVVTGKGPLVLDDLDKINPSDYVISVLFAAINARIAAGNPLLVTTNEPLVGVGKLLGKPILSRLAGYCQVVEMRGPDRRISRPELRAA